MHTVRCNKIDAPHNMHLIVKRSRCEMTYTFMERIAYSRTRPAKLPLIRLKEMSR